MSSLLQVFLSLMFVGDFVIPPGELPSNHSATLTEIPGKKIMACWYAGESEGAEDVQIYCRTQELNSTQWSPSVVAVRRQENTTGNFIQNKTLGNPVLYFNDQDQTLYLFYVVRTIGGWSLSEIAYKSSKDYGQTWNKGKILEGLSERKMSGKLTRSIPLTLAPGKILLPLYYEFNYKQAYSCELDLDHGTIKKKTCQDIPGEGHLQPSLVRIGNKITAYLRSSNAESKIETAVMNIENIRATQWEKTANLTLPNPNSSVAAATTSDGKILLVYNSAGGRNVLNLAISQDGIHFKELTQFENDQGADAGNEYSYPTLFQDSNKVFHLVYTFRRTAIKHIQFTEEWINANEHQ